MIQIEEVQKFSTVSNGICFKIMAKKGSVSRLNSGKIGWFTEVEEEQQWGRVSRHSRTSKEGVVASQAWKSLLHRL